MHDLEEFQIKIKPHSRAKRMKLRYDASSECAVITVPIYSSVSDATRFARRHLDWLRTQKNTSPSRVLLMPGHIIPIQGRDKVIRHVPQDIPQVKISDHEIVVGGTLEGLPTRLENHLKKLARKEIEPIARNMATITYKHFKRIQIRDTKSRWGSCSSTGTLSFSWRLIMTPPEILEYVVAHEIAHLSEMNHSNRFWKIVDDLVIDAKKSRRWLRSEGQKLMLVLSEHQ